MDRSHVFKIAAALIVGVPALFWLIKGAADIVGGVSGGEFNLIVAIVMLGLALLSWKRMLLGGIIMAALAVLLAITFNLILPNLEVAFIPLLLMCAPMVLSGLLFIEADWNKKKRD